MLGAFFSVFQASTMTHIDHFSGAASHEYYGTVACVYVGYLD